MSRKMASKGRKRQIGRRTRETEIAVKLDLDGTGRYKCDIPDEFLGHMVETLARYSGTDIEISAKGDLAHHLIEDVAIALGKTFREALGDTTVQRIGSAVVPMDDALVQVTIDLIDRPFVHLEVPNLMYEHFLRSFAMELKATVHTVVLRGKDEHHVVEATFKALGLALKEAMARSEKTVSTKSKVEWRKA